MLHLNECAEKSVEQVVSLLHQCSKFHCRYIETDLLYKRLLMAPGHRPTFTNSPVAEILATSGLNVTR